MRAGGCENSLEIADAIRHLGGEDINQKNFNDQV